MQVRFDQSDMEAQAKSRRDPLNPDSDLPISRNSDSRRASTSEYRNQKGSFLSQLYQEIECRMMRCMCVFISQMVKRYNEGKPQTEHIQGDCPLIHDGILLTGFDVPPDALVLMAEFVNFKLGSCYKPKITSKYTQPPHPNNKRVAIVKDLQDACSHMTETTTAFANEQRWRLANFVFHRLHTERDMMYSPDGAERRSPLNVDEYLLGRYREHWSGRGMSELEDFVRSRKIDGPEQQALMHSVAHPDNYPEILESRPDDGNPHLIDFYEISQYFCQIFFQIVDPPVPDKPFLELMADGKYQFKSSLEIIKEQSVWACRLPDGRGRQECIKEWLQNPKNLWGPRMVHIVHKAPSMTDGDRDGYLEFNVAPQWDFLGNRLVFNDFRYPASDTKRDYWRCKAMTDEELQSHPCWVWWCWFIHYLFAESPMVAYWHRYWAHMIQRPDEPPAAFLYLYSREQGVGKNIALRVIQSILGTGLWYGGPLAHKRLLRNEKETEGLRSRLWLMDEATRLTNEENLVLTGNCDAPQRNERQLYKNGTVVKIALRQVFLANRDNVIPPSPELIRRKAAILCRPVFVKKNQGAISQSRRLEAIGYLCHR